MMTVRDPKNDENKKKMRIFEKNGKKKKHRARKHDTLINSQKI